ncbi:MAG TPA: ABC transporter permease, partial [Nitrolancea sp.]|nr:ABC transporter permease [Nitrolancea sp.]
MARSVLDTTSASESQDTLGAMKVRSLWSDALRRLVRNRGAAVGGVVFLLIIIVALIAPLIAPYDPIKLNVSDSLESPNGQHWLGTDQFGRDTLSRIIYGSRISVAMGLVAVAISVIGGSVLGLLAGYFRGVTDMLVSRLVDVMLGFPGILLA